MAAQASNVIAWVERELASPTEWRRLRRDLSDVDTAPEAVWQTTRAAAVVGKYCIDASLRYDPSDSVVTFGYLQHELWRGARDSRRFGSSLALSCIDRSLITLAAFSSPTQRESSFSPFESKVLPERAALVRQVTELIQRPQEDQFDLQTSPAAQLTTLGTTFASASGYQALSDAARARRPWDGLGELVAASQDRVPYDEILAAQSDYTRTLDRARSLLDEDVLLASR